MTVNIVLEKQILDNLLYSKRHEIDINTCRIKQTWISKHLPPNSYNYLLNRFSDLSTPKDLPEILYRLYYHIENAPICEVCHINKCKFLGFNKGYNKTCSYKCSLNPDINKNMFEIHDNLNDNIILNHFIDDEHIVSTYATKLHIQQYGYGDYLYNRFSDFNKETDTIQEILYRIKYKIEEKPKCPICGKTTRFRRFNDGYREYCSIECSRKSSSYYYHKNQTRSKTKALKWKKLGFDIKFDPDNKDIYTIYNKCNIHNPFKIYAGTFFNRWNDKSVVLCPICNPERNPETSIETTIKTILDKNNIEYIQHNRIIISPRELDFYLPKYNIGIECNGIYWHSGINGKKRTLTKYNLADKNNIKLLTFWEDDIRNNIETIESIIKEHCELNDILLSINNVFKILEYNITIDFISKNSLSKTNNINNSTINIGLFNKSELIAIGSFTPNETNNYIFSYYVKNGISNIIVKNIIQYFKNNFQFESLIAYSDNEIMNDKVFLNCGFNFISNIKPTYTYYNYKISNKRLTKNDKLLKNTEYSKCIKCYNAGQKMYKLFNENNI